MPKYRGKQIFTRGSFPRNGSKAEERPKVGNNDGQLRIATQSRLDQL